MTYRLLTVSTKIQVDFLNTHIGKLTLEFIWKYKGPENTKANFLKNKTGGLFTLSGFKTNYKFIVMWHISEKRDMKINGKNGEFRSRITQ